MNNKRLIDYLSTHLDPINFIQDYQNKTLPVSILFYKVCSSFPKEKLGGIKGAYKHIQQEKLKIFTQILSPEEFNQVLKNQNFHRPKIGQYIEFITLSLLETCIKDKSKLSFSNFQEDISSGWDFNFEEDKFDITTNLNKIPRPGVKLIKIPIFEIVDQDNLLLPNAINFLALELTKNNIVLADDKLDYTKTLINKVRVKYIEISNHQVKKMTPTASVVIEKSIQTNLEVPEYDGQKLPTQIKEIKTGSVSLDQLQILEKIEKLSPKQKQQLDIILQTLIQSNN
jgi:hypothetical protein